MSQGNAIKHFIDTGNSNNESADSPKIDVLDLVHLDASGALFLHLNLKKDRSHILICEQ